MSEDEDVYENRSLMHDWQNLLPAEMWQDEELHTLSCLIR